MQAVQLVGCGVIGAALAVLLVSVYFWLAVRVGGVICCGRWAAGLAGCGVGRCWRWAAGCCEGWQGVQAVQLVGCGVIGAALALLLVSVCFWLAVRVGGVICCGGGVPAGSSTGPGRH